MAADTESQFSPVHYRLRWLYQRLFTRLPCRLRRFGEIFPDHCDYVGGIFDQRPRFTGLLQREEGKPFFIEPVRYLAGTGRGLGSEQDSYWSREPDRVAFALAQAGVYGNYGRVYDPATRAFIAETCEDWVTAFDQHTALAMPGFPAPQHLPGVSLMLGTLGGQTFYHFFVETLPKLALLRPYLERCDRILLSRYGENWKRRWLALWGLEHKAVFLTELSHFTCDQLIFTNRLVRHFEPGPWCAATLRSLPGLPPVPSAAAAEGRVLWLDRTREHMRPVGWEKDLIAALPPGIEVVRAGELTPQQTAALFGTARALAGFHGAAFSNMVFCPPGTQVLEVFTEPNYPWYGRLARSCGHVHAATVVPDRPESIQAILSQLRALAAPARS